MKIIKDHRPTQVVILGDFVDFHALTVHRQNPAWQDNLMREIASAKRLLSNLREAAPKAKIHYLEGNHEDRWSRMVNGRIPAIRLLGITWERALDLDSLDIVRARPTGIRLPVTPNDYVRFLHGHEPALGLARYPGGTVLRIVQALGENVHIGHCHRVALNYTSVGPKFFFGVEGGYLGDIRKPGFDYAGITPRDWRRAIAIYDGKDPLPKLYGV